MKTTLFYILIVLYWNVNAQFSNEIIITTNALNANFVYATDIDGDGDNDMLSSSQGDDTLAWYENLDGLGNFSAANIIADNLDGTRYITAADLDGDGDMDVLSTTGVDNWVVWYENTNGMGSFGSQQTITSSLNSPRMVIAKDVDADSDLDVLIASSLDNKLTWFENLDGLGNFGLQHIITSNAQNVASIFFIDIDGDGIEDIVCDSSSNGQPAWFKHLDGLGNFGSEQIFTTDTFGAMYAIADDLDGDLDMDIIILEAGGNTIAWYENLDSLGTFGAKQIITTEIDAPRVVYTSDLDNDGDVEVLSASGGDDTIAWYDNNGHGGFGAQQIISTNADGARCVFAADLDGDGYKDAMSASIVDYKIAWYKNLTYLDVKENQLQQIILKPNPTSTMLTIKNTSNIQIDNINIFDTLGRLVLQEKEQFNTIDVSYLNSGLLFVKIETVEGSITKKVVKE